MENKNKTFNKEDVKKLSASASFEINDELAEYFLQFIEKNNELIPSYIDAAKWINLDPIDYPCVENCSKFDLDEPKESNLDALDNAIKADKYVLGK